MIVERVLRRPTSQDEQRAPDRNIIAFRFPNSPVFQRFWPRVPLGDLSQSAGSFSAGKLCLADIILGGSVPHSTSLGAGLYVTFESSRQRVPISSAIVLTGRRSGLGQSDRVESETLGGLRTRIATPQLIALSLIPVMLWENQL